MRDPYPSRSPGLWQPRWALHVPPRYQARSFQLRPGSAHPEAPVSAVGEGLGRVLVSERLRTLRFSQGPDSVGTVHLEPLTLTLL